ncbi:MAG: glycoside hydrolase family 13 protein [Elainellaceae cyanobacterium]
MSIHTPDWVKHAVFYQIFPDRFARSPELHPVFSSAALEPWDAPPTFHGYKGGDLWGVVDQLDYLQDLGITAIYFTPVFQSASNHRYHTHDYYRVDPLLGGNEALEKLLTSAHSRGIRVLLDGVFNHSSRGFFFFNDILENGTRSPWVDWFRIHDWPLSAYDEEKPANYASWWGLRALPQFNHENPAVREYLMQVGEYWIKQGVDGWRLDVPNEIKADGFWQEFRDRVKAVNPEAYIVGEIWEDARHWLDGTQFDGVMNYLFTAPTIAFTAGDRVDLPLVENRSYRPYPALDAAGYAAKIQELLDLYPWEIHLTQLNLLDSHDTARLISIARGDRDSVKLATLLLLTFPGAPSIYYGDEVGLPGGSDPDCRRGFPTPDQWDRDTLAYHRELIALRHNHPALRTGDYRTLAAAGHLYVFSRTLGQDSLLIAVNASPDPAEVTLAADTLPTNPVDRHLWGIGDFHLTEGQLTLRLPGRSGLVMG